MAERPVFLPSPPTDRQLVRERSFRFSWHSGFAAIQKKKNVSALHAAAAASRCSPLLEVSTKSDDELGRHLSAFHLRVETAGRGRISLESAFQGSKVFEGGGPYTDLYGVDARVAKRDQRLRSSGQLIRFDFEALSFDLEPKTAFYDWLYLGAVFPHRKWLERLYRYRGFTDIEFNPARSINCQARSCALFVALMRRGQLESAIASQSRFLEVLKSDSESTDAQYDFPQPCLAASLDLPTSLQTRVGHTRLQRQQHSERRETGQTPSRRLRGRAADAE